MDIKVVTVIGANGTMGSNISAIFGSFGNAKVYMLDMQKSDMAVKKAVGSVRSDSIEKNLVPADYDDLEKCVKESDLVFESVIENIEIKKQVALKVAKYLKKNALFCTGTSGLSINEICSVLPDEIRCNYYGVHFFNPPYNMSLCEVIPNSTSNHQTTIKLVKYLELNLLRKVVVVNDKPAFLANRIGFQFINLALQYAEKYKNEGGIDYIDTILGSFTGRAMAPCATADFVGLDVHEAIVNNLLTNTNDYSNSSFKLPSYVKQLVDEKKLGRKVGEGLFKLQISESGKKEILTYSIIENKYLPKQVFKFDLINEVKEYLKNGDYELAFSLIKNDKSKEAEICRFFLKDYVDYSKFVAEEVGCTIFDADIAMAYGFNWCPPSQIANLFFDANYQSKIDYRSYFKVGK